MDIPTLGFVFNVCVLVLTAILHVVLALAVYSDGEAMRTPEGNRGTTLVGPEIWALAALLGGLVAAGIYWAVHHSTLRQDKPPGGKA